MYLLTIDKIVKRHLFNMNLPIHYYVECLSHAIRCLEELSYNTLQIVQTKELVLDAAFAAPLPCDYIDFIGVGLPTGQWLRPISQRTGITRLANSDSHGQDIPYPTVPTQTGANYGYGTGPFWGFSWYWNINDLGESRGRLFGSNAGISDPDGFKIIKERGVIQFTQTLTNCGRNPVLTYIGRYTNCDNATQVDPLVVATIEAYIEWKRDQSQRNMKGSPKEAMFASEWRQLKARLNPMTAADIRNILQRNYSLSVKN